MNSGLKSFVETTENNTFAYGLCDVHGKVYYQDFCKDFDMAESSAKLLEYQWKRKPEIIKNSEKWIEE